MKKMNILKLPKMVPDEECQRLLKWVDDLTIEEVQELEKMHNAAKAERGTMEQQATGQDTKAKLQDSFTYHSPRENQVPRYEQLRAKAKELSFMIDDMVPGGREKSLAITKLEESIMWANKAIALEKE